jgi:hypothetical protein
MEKHTPAGDEEKEILILDRWACDPFDFYTKYHPSDSRAYAPEIARRFDVSCLQHNTAIVNKLRRSLRSERDRAWVMVGKPWIFDRLRRKGLKNFQVVKNGWAGGFAIYAVRRK